MCVQSRVCTESKENGSARSPVCQEVLNPEAEVEPYTQVRHLGEQCAGEDGIKCRAVVHKQ